MAPPAQARTATGAESAPLVFINARLVGSPTTATYAVEVADGRVAAVISTEEHVEAASSAAVLDLQGAYLAPSVVDSHTHFSSWALAAQRIDLYTALSAAEVLSRMRAWLPIARSHQPDPSLFLVGQRMRIGEWPDLPDMNRLALDALEPDRPLAIFFAGFHSLCANSRALKRLGHEPEGHSGVLEEKECFDAWVEINRIPEDSVDAAVAQAALNAAAQGITEILDLEMAFNIDNWQRRVSKKGIKSLRVRCGMYRDHLPQAIAAGYRTGNAVSGTDGLVTVGPHKIITDGSLGSRTACCHHAYPNEPENFGHFEYEVPTLQGMLEKATAAGMSLAVHAIGDRANQLTLETFATLNSPALPGSTIEHAQLLSTEDIPLFKRLGLIASIQPVHMADDRELAEQFWPGRTNRAFPFRTIVDAGIPIRMGSDAPVAPVDPWDAMAVAVPRVGRGQSHLPPWHPEQAISNEQAWLASTSNGKISFEVGDRADLIVIPVDPLVASAEELREMKVKATMLGGRWTHYTL